MRNLGDELRNAATQLNELGLRFLATEVDTLQATLAEVTRERDEMAELLGDITVKPSGNIYLTAYDGHEWIEKRDAILTAADNKEPEPLHIKGTEE